MSTIICADLIPLIVSYVPLNDLRSIAASSVIFDIEICKQGIRMLYYDHCTVRLTNKHKVIRMETNRTIIIIDNKLDYQGKFIGPFENGIIQELTNSPNDLYDFFDNTCYYVDLDNMKIIGKVSSTEYYIVSVDRFEIMRGIYRCLIGNTYYDIDRQCIYTAELVIEMYNGDTIIIDYNGKYVVNDCDNLEYCKFVVLYEDGEWIK